VRKTAARSVTVTLLDEAGSSAHRWTFRNTRPGAIPFRSSLEQ